MAAHAPVIESIVRGEAAQRGFETQEMRDAFILQETAKIGDKLVKALLEGGAKGVEEQIMILRVQFENPMNSTSVSKDIILKNRGFGRLGPASLEPASVSLTATV